VFVPVMVPALFLMAIGPLANWKQADMGSIVKRLRLAAVIALLAGAGLPFLVGQWTPLVAMGLALAVWIAASCAFQVQAWLKKGNPPLSFWGMQVAHFGIAVFVVGVTMVKGYEVEKDVRMAVGETVEVAGYQFKLLGIQSVSGPNYDAARGEFELSKNGKVLRTLEPEKRNYRSSAMPMTETAIDSGITRDVYVSMGESLDEGRAWAVRVYYKPFVTWIWVGCLFMALGGALAAADRRYRFKIRQSAAVQGAAA